MVRLSSLAVAVLCAVLLVLLVRATGQAIDGYHARVDRAVWCLDHPSDPDCRARP